MNSSDITKYRHDLEVIRMTAEQVKKDFSFHNVEITFSGNEMIIPLSGVSNGQVLKITVAGATDGTTHWPLSM